MYICYLRNINLAPENDQMFVKESKLKILPKPHTQQQNGSTHWATEITH